MSIQWTFVATFLYCEIALILLLLIPFISPISWQKVFKSRVLRSLSSHAKIYFSILIVILVIFFFDSIREIRKYSNSSLENPKHDPMIEIQINMKLFRAQRNFYIAGFALFLWLVLCRLTILISTQAYLMASNEASIKQAISASEAAKKLLIENKEHIAEGIVQGKSELETEINKRKEAENEIDKLREELKMIKDELQKSHLNLETVKKQAKSVTQEYDRLLDEHAKLQAELKQQTGMDGSKKED